MEEPGETEIDLRELGVPSHELWLVSGVTVHDGADGEVCRFAGGFALGVQIGGNHGADGPAGHAGVRTSGGAARREGCRQERVSISRLFLNLMMWSVIFDEFMEIFSLQYQRKEGMTLCFFPVYIDRVKQHCTLY